MSTRDHGNRPLATVQNLRPTTPLLARMEEVNTARWHLRGKRGFELRITGWGANWSESYHAELVKNGRILYKSDGDSRHDAWLRLIQTIPVDQLQILRAFLP